MKKLRRADLAAYIGAHIRDFHRARLESIARLRLRDVLARKNPYLFKAKHILTAQDLVKTLLDAHLSSQEETLFGDFLEGLAIFVCGKVYRGRKSAAEGIDLEFEKDGAYYLVTIKSGPNWGNSSQIARMRDTFRKAKRILGSRIRRNPIVAVNGCCYGRDARPDKGDYLKLCGERFWEFISDDSHLYTEIVEPLGHRAKGRNEEFHRAYARIINSFTLEFGKEFCVNGAIDWKRLVRFNSAVAKAPGRLT